MEVINYDPNEALENLFHNNRSVDFVVAGNDNDNIVISDDEDSQDTQEEVNKI